MTPEAWIQFLHRSDGQTCTAADAMQLAEMVAPWTEAERKKLSKATVALYRNPMQWPFVDYGEYLKLAVLAVGPISELKRNRHGHYHRFEPAALKILQDRRPEWIDEWIESKLNGEWPEIPWSLLHDLMRRGVCHKPKVDGYARLFTTIGYRWGTSNQTPRCEQLLNEPELIEDVWRLFQVETQAFNDSVTYGSEYEDWSTTLVRLSELGHLDRQRLIEACIRAIGGDFSAQAITGYTRLYERLAPTIEDQATGQTAFLELLASRHSHVVTFALEQLAALEKAGKLDGAAFLASATSVFALKPKGQPLQALVLAGKLAKQDAALVYDVANLAIEALNHPAGDVQKAAAKLLETWSARLHRDHASELREKLDGLAATVRPRIAALIEQLSPASSEPAPAAHLSLEEWNARAEAIPAEWRSLSGLNDALECAESDQLYQGYWANINFVPVLTSCAEITPIATVDELLDAVAHALEELNSADELERILDGVSRLCDQRTDNFELRAAPLVKRLTAELKGELGHGIAALRGMDSSLPQLMRRWLGHKGENCRARRILSDPRPSAAFVECRLREIEQRVVAQRAAPLLSAPTHEHGWLDARALVRRLAYYSTSDRDPPVADFIQALLRLAPDGRAAARDEATSLPGLWGAVVRFALGVNETPAIHDDRTFSLWLAAARARQTRGHLELLAPSVSAERYPLLIEPRIAWEALSTTETHAWAGQQRLRLAIEPELPHHPANELRPTLAAREGTYNRWDSFTIFWSRNWLDAIWPANLDAMLAEGVRMLCERVDSPASSLEPNHFYLRPLLQPDRPWNELSYLAVWIALLSKDAGSRGMALDVLITAIEDGRALPKTDVLAKLCKASWAKLNRLAEAGREIARVSPRHAWWWGELLERLAMDLHPWPKDMQHLLDLWLELLSELELGLHEFVRERLQSVTTTGKAAKLQKALLARVTSPNSARRTAAHEQALAACFARAERWSRGQL